jgi:hypothetical protein
MLELVFHAEGGSASVSVAESFGVMLANGRLSAGGGPVLAAHLDGTWRIGETAVARITCKGPIAIELDTAGQCRRFGPFADVVIGNKTIWTAAGPFARYSAFTKAWALADEATETTAVPERIRLVAA